MESSYTENLFERLAKNLDFKNEKKVFSKQFGGFIWFVTDSSKKVPSGFHNSKDLRCTGCSISKRSRSLCVDYLKESMQRSQVSRSIEKFICLGKFHGFSYPIVQGNKVYGFIVVCQLKQYPASEMIDIFSAFTDTVVKEVQREMELQKLTETIRPRAVALSTVHTLHRLISSTLNLSELLPRIARLSLQVMRASRCSIKLVDSKRKILIPKTTVDLRKTKTKLKKVKIGRWAPGKAVKFARPIRGREYLAAPLIDEDVIGVITIYDRIDKKPFTDFDEEIMKTFCEQAVIAIKNAQLFKEQEQLTLGAIRSIASILKTSVQGSLLPEQSFLKIVNMIGHELKMSEYELKILQYASILHDAGQLSLPKEILKKRGILTGHEYRLMKEHPKKGASILKPLKPLRGIVPIILHHHERYDGKGYPSGLKGNNIPLGARIMGVVGAFEAMISKKTYRRRMTISSAVKEIKKNSGTQFDPKVVVAFLDAMHRKGVIKMLEREIHGFKKSNN